MILLLMPLTCGTLEQERQLRTCPYFFLMMDLRLWYTSAPARRASEKVLQPVGRIMNSCTDKHVSEHTIAYLKRNGEEPVPRTEYIMLPYCSLCTEKHSHRQWPGRKDRLRHLFKIMLRS